MAVKELTAVALAGKMVARALSVGVEHVVLDDTRRQMDELDHRCESINTALMEALAVCASVQPPMTVEDLHSEFPDIMTATLNDAYTECYRAACANELIACAFARDIFNRAVATAVAEGKTDRFIVPLATLVAAGMSYVKGWVLSVPEIADNPYCLKQLAAFEETRGVFYDTRRAERDTNYILCGVRIDMRQMDVQTNVRLDICAAAAAHVIDWRKPGWQMPTADVLGIPSDWHEAPMWLAQIERTLQSADATEENLAPATVEHVPV